MLKMCAHIIRLARLRFRLTLTRLGDARRACSWLGSAFLGFDAAQQFHPVYGPALMVAFAVLSQTLRAFSCAPLRTAAQSG